MDSGELDSMEIRAADQDDVGKIAALYISNHVKTYSGLLPEEYFEALTPEYAYEKWNAYRKDDEKIVWVAYKENEFLGFAAGMKDAELENTWYLDSLHITPNARGKGIGTALIRKMKEYARYKLCSYMSICIVRGNENAGKLYQKLGAKHYSFFDDDFRGVVSHSEKMLWTDLRD